MATATSESHLFWSTKGWMRGPCWCGQPPQRTGPQGPSGCTYWSKAVLAGSHTHLLPPSTIWQQLWGLCSQDSGTANRPSQALPAPPRPSTKKIFQSKQKQSICLWLNRQVFYLPCCFGLSSSDCKVLKLPLLSFIKAGTMHEETRTRPPPGSSALRGSTGANMAARAPAG